MVAAVAIVGAVALTVATFGAGAVIGAAVVGAVLGAIGGVVMTASSDIANGKMSSAYDYLKSAAQGAVIGAICGAIFGPAVGIGGGAVVPMTGGLTTSSIGSGMFIGGSSSYIDYSIRELWDGRTPDAGKALESFAFGALLGGGFMLGGSWLAQGVSKIKGLGKGGASPKVDPKVDPKSDGPGDSEKLSEIQRLQEALRSRILGYNHEQGKFSYNETLGISRAEKALNKRFQASDTLGVDMKDPGGLGNISLKGPFLNNNRQPLTQAQQEAVIKNLTKHINNNTAVDAHIIDTLGLDAQVVSVLKEALKNSKVKIYLE